MAERRRKRSWIPGAHVTGVEERHFLFTWEFLRREIKRWQYIFTEDKRKQEARRA
jgi:hypothetical protein